MQTIWIQFVCISVLACNVVENVGITIKRMMVERQRTISSSELILVSFEATSAIHCTAECNRNANCLYGSYQEEGKWCYLYSNRNPSIENHTNNLVFTKCYVSREAINLTTYDDQPTIIGALSTFPTDRFLTLWVKACPHISLHFKGETDEYFFVDIGFDNGMTSRINYFPMYSAIYTYHNDPIMTCDSVSSFWITWFDDVIEVGKSDVIGNDKFMINKVGGTITPRYMFKVQSENVIAEWSIKMNKDTC